MKNENISRPDDAKEENRDRCDAYAVRQRFCGKIKRTICHITPLATVFKQARLPHFELRRWLISDNQVYQTVRIVLVQNDKVATVCLRPSCTTQSISLAFWKAELNCRNRLCNFKSKPLFSNRQGVQKSFCFLIISKRKQKKTV